MSEDDESRDEDEDEASEEPRRIRRRRLHSEEDVFTMPLPAPPFPGEHRGKVIFFRDADEAEPGKEHEDIMLRKVPTAVAMHFRAAAGGRSLTHAQYLAALVGLHEAMRALADAGDAKVSAELARLGLSSVTV